MAILARILGSRVGVVVILVLALFAWHKIDKTSAVRRAVVTYVAGVELSAAEAENEELARRAQISYIARQRLIADLGEITISAERTQRELEAYAKSNPVNANCVVDDSLLEWLRSAE